MILNRNCNMRQASDGNIVANPSVGYGDGVYSGPAEDGIEGGDSVFKCDPT